MRAHVENSRPRNAGATRQDNAGGDPERVTRLLYQKDRADTEGRGGTKMVHASSTIRMPLCPRAYYLAYELRQAGVRFTETPWGSMKLVWAYGRAAEKHVRDTLLSDQDMRADAYGLWKCRCGHTKHTGQFLPSAAACTQCRTRPVNYNEALLLDPDYALSGNPDFIFRDGPLYRVVEIKSIKGKDENSTSTSPNFEDLTAPQPDHVNQAGHYVALAERRGLPVHRRPLVLYVSKKFEQRSWYKPFIPGDGAMQRAEEAVHDQRETTRSFREALQRGQCPGMIEDCVADSSCKQRSCPVWAECMARRMAA